MLFNLIALAAVAKAGIPTPIFQFPDCSSGPLSKNGVCDSSKAPQARAKALVGAMNTKEKINNLINASPGSERLGLPPYEWWQEALHGIATGNPGVNFSSKGEFSYATSFPQPILMSAAFDDKLIHDVATVISTETRAFNNFNRSGLDYWTPNINPFKDPRWGRGQETPGEDPFHIQSYVTQLLHGLQGGENPKIKKIIATCKHLAGYDMENWLGYDRTLFNAKIDSQDMAEYYLPPFQTCARDANVGSVMCAYNAVNGVPSCADSYLMQDILRDHWHWTNEQQYITSDCDAVQDIYLPHGFSDSPTQAAADALKAGTDSNCGSYYATHLPVALKKGLIKESDIDKALMRKYAGLVRTGYFDSADATPYRSLDWSDVSTKKSQALALKAAEEGMTLLKNDGILPFTFKSGMNIAMIGSWAHATTQMLGNYYGYPPYMHSPLYAARQIPGVKVHYATGVGGQGDPTTDSSGLGGGTAGERAGWREALRVAKKSDVIILCDGIDNSVESEGLDRTRIDWTGEQVDLAQQLASLGKPVILAQFGGGQLDDTPFLNDDRFRAIVWGGYPGQDGGVALMNIIQGKTAPAGRLPVTQYPQKYVREVPMTDMTLRPNSATGNPGRTYRWYPEDSAVMPFGYGMHYTTFSLAPQGSSIDGKTFEISDLVNSKACKNQQYKDLCSFGTLPVKVSNTGKTTSDYSLLAFVAGKFGPAPYPIKTLVAYERLHDIEAGQSQTANLKMTLGNLARRDDNGNLVLYPGSYEIMMDVPAVKQMVKFTLKGQEMMLDRWPQPKGVSSGGS